MKTIQCDLCNTEFEYEENSWTSGNEVYEDTESMPDGYLIDGQWICDDCGSCKFCGTTLDKLPDRRGPDGSRMCDNEECIEDYRCGNCHGRGYYMGDTMVGTYEQLECETCNGSGEKQ